MAIDQITGLEETEDQVRARAAAQFQDAQQVPSQLAMLQGDGSGTGVNMMPPPAEAQPPLGPPDPNALALFDKAIAGAKAREEAQPDETASAAALAPVQPPRPSAPPKPKGPDELDAVNKANATAAGQVGDAAIAKAQVQTAAADAEAYARRTAEAEQFRRSQVAQAEESRLQAKAEAEDAKYKSMGFKDFWADKTTGARVLGAIGVALGAAGASLNGGPNYGLEIIDKAIDRDYQRQRDAILKQKDVVSEARGLAKEAKAEKLISLEGWRAAAWDAVKAQSAAMLAKSGVGVEEAGKSSLVASAAEKAMEAREAQKKGAAQLGLIKAETVKNYADASEAKDRGAKLKSEAAAGPKENAKGIADARQRAMIVTGLTDQDRIVQRLESSGVQLTDKDLQRIQDNRTYLEAQAHGDGGALKTVLLRKWGVIPRNEFDGLDEKKKQLAGAKSLMTQKAAMLAAGSQTEGAIKHATGIVDLLAPGLGPEERARRHEYIRTDLIGANQGLVPGQVAAARSGATAVGSEPPRPPTSTGLPPGAVAGTYKGMKGYQINGHFYVDDSSDMASR